MSSWTYALTNKGRQLQAKAQTGIKLEYTRMAVGSGTLAGQSLAAMTALITPVKNLPIVRLKHPEGSTRALVGATLTNADVTTGFYLREIGIYAMDPDDGEILYMYANAGSTADYIAPSGDGVIQKAINMNVIVGTATNISAVIDESLVYVTRDEFEEALANIDVDVSDASLTEKGIVQLTNAIDSISEKIAPTAKAVNDARQAAINAAATDATLKSNAAETKAKNYVDGKPWQKVAVTSDSGFALNISSANLNDPRNTGWYMGTEVVNAPSNEWHFFEIIRHNDLWEVQKAYNFNGVSFRQRMKQNGAWTAWSPDVFQSGVDAKQGIVNAINAKGGSASMNDTWATLAAKINAIQTGPKFASGTTNSAATGLYFQSYSTQDAFSTYHITVTGLGFRPNRIVIRHANFNPNVFIVYDTSILNAVPTAGGTNFNRGSWADGNNGSAGTYIRDFAVWEFTGSGTRASGAYVNDSGFRMPVTFVPGANTPFKWEAYGV